jgi:hypothetical protein
MMGVAFTAYAMTTAGGYLDEQRSKLTAPHRRIYGLIRQLDPR